MIEELTILVLDDEVSITDKIVRFLKRLKVRPLSANSPLDAEKLLDKYKVDIIILDYYLPQKNGIEFLKEVKVKWPDIEVIMITGHGDSEIILAAMKNGAFDFFNKPVSLVDLQASIERTGKYISLNNRLKEAESISNVFSEKEKSRTEKIIGTSSSIKKVLETASKSASSRNTPVLITGQSGTGKELIARTIHYNSERKNSPFYTLNCSAIPPGLIESELFGHIKGAFTGASSDKQGAFRFADKGTLFLDEIGDMPIEAQSKLLRVLEDKTVRAVGGTKDISVDVRVVSATNQNLDELVKRKAFRLDLFHRINTMIIDLPPLNKRLEDIPLLVDYYVEKLGPELGKNITKIDDDVYVKLKTYTFPGNIRELKNIIERAILLCDGSELNSGSILLNSDKATLASNEVKSDIDDMYDLGHLEINTIKKALESTRYNQKEAAKLLNITRYSLNRKMKKYNLR
jgi:DNA-binding NtrC family response regulator